MTRAGRNVAQGVLFRKQHPPTAQSPPPFIRIQPQQKHSCRVLGYMETEVKKAPRTLERGQLWKIEAGYVYIVELGERLIHYRMLRDPNQRAALTRMIAIEALAVFLWHSEAELV